VLAQTLAGPLGGVFGQYVGWRGVFVVLSALSLLIAAGFALRIKALPDRRSNGRMINPDNYARMARHRTGRLVLLAAALDGMAFVGFFPFLAPYLHEHFFLPYAHVGLLLACFGLGAWLYTLLARRLLPRLGEGGMVLAGGLLMAAALLLAVTAGHWAQFVLVELMLGLGFFMLHGVLQAQATEILPNARATAVATFACLLFLGQSAGALIAGALIARSGYVTAFTIDAACIVLLALWIWSFLRKPPSLAHA
jgi:predicted MFS family arabinose efflux permease